MRLEDPDRTLARAGLMGRRKAAELWAVAAAAGWLDRDSLPEEAALAARGDPGAAASAAASPPAPVLAVSTPKAPPRPPSTSSPRPTPAAATSAAAPAASSCTDPKTGDPAMHPMPETHPAAQASAPVRHPRHSGSPESRGDRPAPVLRRLPRPPRAAEVPSAPAPRRLPLASVSGPMAAVRSSTKRSRAWLPLFRCPSGHCTDPKRPRRWIELGPSSFDGAVAVT